MENITPGLTLYPSTRECLHRYCGNGSICLMDQPEVRRCRQGQKGIMVPLFLLSPDLPHSVIWTGHWGYTVRVSGPQRPALPHKELGCVYVGGCVGVLDCWWKTNWDKVAITVYVYDSCYRLWMAHPAVVLFLPCRGKSYWHDVSLSRLAITRWTLKYWNDLFSPCPHLWIGKWLNCETIKERKMNKTKHTESPRPFSKSGAYTFAL